MYMVNLLGAVSESEEDRKPHRLTTEEIMSIVVD